MRKTTGGALPEQGGALLRALEEEATAIDSFAERLETLDLSNPSSKLESGATF